MSLIKLTAVAALIGTFALSTNAYAGAAGGGTELPSNAEPGMAKNPAEKKMDKGGSMEKGGMQKDGGSMQKGGAMKKSDDKM